MTIQTVNPFDNKVINSFPEMGAEQINQAITKAHEAFISWKHSSFATRAQLIHKAAEIMRKNGPTYLVVFELQ